MNKRLGSSYLIAIGSLLLGALAIAQAIWFSSQILETTAIVFFLLGLIWAYYVFPKVELREDLLVITNPLTVSMIGFGAIEEIDTRFALKIIGESKSVSAWAAPAPGRTRHRSHPREDFRVLGLKEGAEVRPGDLPSSISGSFALQIRQAITDGKTGNRTWQTRVNPLGLALILMPLAFLIWTHL